MLSCWFSLVHDVYDTLSKLAGCVCDITDTDCQAQNGSTHGCVFNFEILIF